MQPDKRRPNIVFVFADQLRACDLSCYGGTNIRTAHMDRLAREGVRLTNAVSTYPICSPFRAMLLTGQYPMRNGMVCNDHYLKPDVPSFAQACRDAGYHTGYIGKWHIDGVGRTAYIPPERRLGFEHWMVLECTHDYFNSAYYENDSDEMKHWDGYDAETQTRAAQEYIRERAAQDRPFALFLSWGPPHDPYIAPQAYMDRVKPEGLSLRPNVAERALADALHENRRVEPPAPFLEVSRSAWAWLNDDETLREAYVGYLAATWALDNYLGELLRTIEQAGIVDDTIIVFTSDHGDTLGSHRFFGKETPFAESISIPFIVRYPAKIQAASTCDALLSPVDIMPTLLGLAGVPCPDVDGLDMSCCLTHGRSGPRDALLLMAMTHFGNAPIINGMDTWRGVRTPQYTYARWDDGTPWLLYDNERDPYQMTNLIDDSAHAELLRQLDGLLPSLLAEAGDPVDTKALYDRIQQEKPDREIVDGFRQANPGAF